MVDCTRSHSIL
jgi:hypothetical protein